MTDRTGCRWPGHENLPQAEREAYGCNPEPDACGHGDNPDETCDGCYG